MTIHEQDQALDAIAVELRRLNPSLNIRRDCAAVLLDTGGEWLPLLYSATFDGQIVDCRMPGDKYPTVPRSLLKEVA